MEYLIGGLAALIGYLYVLLRVRERQLQGAKVQVVVEKNRAQTATDDESVATARKVLALSIDRYTKGEGK